ncbi:MAG TPA: alpha/beta hydrolase [Polyangiaceae bacterium]|nr:alpha/beta hydrolase [Polyangiaceae bacterium]
MTTQYDTANQQRNSSGARERLLQSLPVRERRLELAGVETAVLEGGEGPPVVLLHGPGAYAAHWLRIIPALVTEHRVIVPDLPGHGASTVISGALNADRVLGWLDELLKETCTDRPALVGQLLGGAIAARFAVEHGDRLRSLTLIDTFGLSEFRPAPEFADALTRFMTEPDPRTHDNLWRYCARDLKRLRDAMGEYWSPFEQYNVDRARTPSVQRALHALMEAFSGPIPERDLARITAPTALIWGRYDMATALEVAEAASVRYAWPLHVIEAANDDPPVEQPEALIRVLAGLIKAS